MKKLFRKATTVLGSVALIGATVGMAAAASYPEPFTSNTAIVVGANAAPSDNIAAASFASFVASQPAVPAASAYTERTHLSTVSRSRPLRRFLSPSCDLRSRRSTRCVTWRLNLLFPRSNRSRLKLS